MEETWNKMVTRKGCSSLREHLGVKLVMFGVCKDWMCKEECDGMASVFQDSVCFTVYARISPSHLSHV